MWVVSLFVLGGAGLKGGVSFAFDNIGVLCLRMLFLCGVLSLVYCFHYLGADSMLFFLMV